MSLKLIGARIKKILKSILKKNNKVHLETIENDELIYN